MQHLFVLASLYGNALAVPILWGPSFEAVDGLSMNGEQGPSSISKRQPTFGNLAGGGGAGGDLRSELKKVLQGLMGTDAMGGGFAQSFSTLPSGPVSTPTVPTKKPNDIKPEQSNTPPKEKGTPVTPPVTPGITKEKSPPVAPPVKPDTSKIQGAAGTSPASPVGPKDKDAASTTPAPDSPPKKSDPAKGTDPAVTKVPAKDPAIPQAPAKDLPRAPAKDLPKVLSKDSPASVKRRQLGNFPAPLDGTPATLAGTGDLLSNVGKGLGMLLPGPLGTGLNSLLAGVGADVAAGKIRPRPIRSQGAA